jgi:hypothetical protein
MIGRASRGQFGIPEEPVFQVERARNLKQSGHRVLFSQAKPHREGRANEVTV